MIKALLVDTKVVCASFATHNCVNILLPFLLYDDGMVSFML